MTSRIAASYGGQAASERALKSRCELNGGMREILANARRFTNCMKTSTFAFLEIDVTNGKTFEIANILERKQVPFVFVSGSCQAELPFELHSAPFIPKPFSAAQIERALQAVAGSLP
jgi:hypothetical protein